MNIVCNSSPLIFLSKINRIELLSDLFEKTYIPKAVWHETTAKPDASNKAFKKSKSIEVFNVQNKVAVNAMLGRLHIGEVEVIIGAQELGLSNVILDDGYARNKAKQIGLSVVGTLGLLILARERGIIKDLSEDINRLKAIGFRISDAILNNIL